MRRIVFRQQNQRAWHFGVFEVSVSGECEVAAELNGFVRSRLGLAGGPAMGGGPSGADWPVGKTEQRNPARDSHVGKPRFANWSSNWTIWHLWGLKKAGTLSDILVGQRLTPVSLF
jgi:hypothetical protein